MTPKQLIELLTGAEVGDIFPKYSGRGMFAAECPAIVTDNPALLGAAMMKFLTESHRHFDEGSDRAEEELLAVLLHTAQDDFGRKKIFYWPRVRWEKK